MPNTQRDTQTLQLAADLGEALWSHKWQVATAESCSGGGVAAAITAIAGSSNWFEYGLVTYANKAKQNLLGVSAKSLAIEGAVSEVVVQEMVSGVLTLSEADIGVAVSGIAGPGGGTLAKPVGTVWFAWGLATGQRATACHRFEGDRRTVQQQAVIAALAGLLDLVKTIAKKTD